MRLRNRLIFFAVLLAATAASHGLLQDLKAPTPPTPTHPPGQGELLVAPSTPVFLGPPTWRPTKHQLVVGAVHTYLLPLKAGKSVDLIAYQDGVDLQVAVFDPGGKPLFIVDSPNGNRGPERVLLVADIPTRYRIEVSGRGKNEAGPYRIWITPGHRTTKRDRKMAMAEGLYFQAQEEIARTTDWRSPEAKLIMAASLWKETGDPGWQADSLKLLGKIYAQRWEWQRSLQVRRQARIIYHSVRRFDDEGAVFNDIGYAYEQLSDLAMARDSYQKALSLGGRYHNDRVIAAASHNLGSIIFKQGRFAEALKNFERARNAWKKVGDIEEAKTLIAIGGVLADAGKWSLAMAKYREALVLSEQCHDFRKKALALNGLAGLYLKLGEQEQARRFYLEALKIQQEKGSLNDVPTTLNNLAVVFLNDGKYQDAIDLFQKVLRLFDKKGNPLDQARTLTNMGWTYSALGREKDSRWAYERALALAKGRDSWTEAGALLGLARLEEARGNPIAAQEQAEAAVKCVEDQRTAAGEGLRISFLATRQDIYDALIEILLWQHELHPSAEYAARALRISEQARSRGLLDEVSVFRGEKGLPTSQILSLSDIQRSLLDLDTLLLEYHLGRKASFLWVVGKNSYQVFKLPPKRQLEALLKRVSPLLVSSARREKFKEVSQSADELSQALLGRAAPLLGQKRLLISSPDILQTVPFGVLPDPTVSDASRQSGRWPTPMIMNHEIVRIPSASVLAMIRTRAGQRVPPRDLLAMLADPVSGDQDERLAGIAFPSSKSRSETPLDYLFGRFGRLAHAREEAKAIMMEAGSRGVFSAFGFDATRELAMSGQLKNFRNLHFATHGLLRADDSDLSALVLSLRDRYGRRRDGFLRAADIKGLDLPADLVVLSACDTGLGESIKGEGMVGLPQAFLAAGATGVVVSLWPVDDLATSVLMKRFYHEYLSKGLPPSAALREAQKAMWMGTVRNAPFYWGGFEIQGDWRSPQPSR